MDAWFYGQLDTIFVNSGAILAELDRTRDRSRVVKILPPGLDTRLFTPGRSDPDFGNNSAATPEACVFCSSGLLKEKGLDILVQAFRNLQRDNVPVELSIVGHGPYSTALADIMPEACYTGYLNGTELAKAVDAVGDQQRPAGRRCRRR